MIADKRLAQLAADAYSLPCTHIAGDIAARVTYEDSYYVVAIRGTRITNLDDWLRDLSAWPQRDPWLGYCHAGFLSGVDRLIKETEIIGDLRGKRVLLVGHSLGGALAELLGAKLVVMAMSPVRIVTFGAPRIGFHKVCRVIMHTVVTLRYVHGNDPVPDKPYWLPWWPYQHPGDERRFGQSTLIDLECHPIASYLADM